MNIESRAAFAQHLNSLQFHHSTISIYFKMLDGDKSVVLREEIWTVICEQYYKWLMK